MKKRKSVTVTLVVSAPKEMPIAAIRREVRTLVNEQCNYSAFPGDIKVRKITKGKANV